MRNFIHQFKSQRAERLLLESLLITVVGGLAWLMFLIPEHKLVILNLFYLPIVLSGFFMGRYRTGVLGLLGVIAASIVASQQLDHLFSPHDPRTIVLVLAIWGSVLGLTALLVGSLSDENRRKQCELHNAYVGVVDVMSKYLQSANPRLKARSTRVAELSQWIATDLHLSPQLIDDIRVAALMHDLGKIEVTTRILTKAIDTLDTSSDINLNLGVSFQGIDLVHSLGSIMKGAIPLLINQDDTVWGTSAGSLTVDSMPLGARIIRVVRVYDDLTEGGQDANFYSPADALKELKHLCPTHYDASILGSLERMIERNSGVRIAELA